MGRVQELRGVTHSNIPVERPPRRIRVPKMNRARADLRRPDIEKDGVAATPKSSAGGESVALGIQRDVAPLHRGDELAGLQEAAEGEEMQATEAVLPAAWAAASVRIEPSGPLSPSSLPTKPALPLVSARIEAPAPQILA